MPKRARGLGDQPYIPDNRLIQRYAFICCWEPAKLNTVLFQFGQLSEEGQEQLIRYVVLAHGRYQMLAKTKRRTAPSEQRKQLKAIEITAKKLLYQLGINTEEVAPSPLWELSDRPPLERLRTLGKQSPTGSGVTNRLALASVSMAARDVASVNAELGKANNRVAKAVIALLCIHERAKTAVHAATGMIAPGRGGSRRRPEARGQLIKDAITIYAQMRMRHPDSGHEPGFGGPMLRFINAIAALHGVRLGEAEIRDVWRLRKSKQK